MNSDKSDKLKNQNALQPILDTLRFVISSEQNNLVQPQKPGTGQRITKMFENSIVEFLDSSCYS